MKNEKEIENALLSYLELRGCFPCKIESQGTFDPTKGVRRANKSRFKRNGISDIMFFYKDVVWYCEVKVPAKLKYIIKHWDRLADGAVVSQQGLTNQINFLKSVRKKKQVGIFVDSVERLGLLMEYDLSIVPFY